MYLDKNQNKLSGIVGDILTELFTKLNIKTKIISGSWANTQQDFKDYKIDALYRAGISVPVWNNNIEFALDVDLTKNETLIKDEKSQMLGVGVELHPSSWFALRLGAMKDLASETYDDGTIMTGGLGIGLKWFQIDLSAMVSSNKGRYDNEDIPRYISANLSIISRWGYGYNK